MSKLPLRQDLNVNETWDLSLLFKSQEDYDQEIVALQEEVQSFVQRYKNQLTSVPTILESLQAFELIRRRLNWIILYGYLGYEVDKTNQQYEDNVIRLGFISSNVQKALSFYQTELASVDESLLNEVCQSDEGAVYTYFIDELMRFKEIMLSPDVEEALSYLNNNLFNSSNLYDATKFQDMVFDDFEAEGQTYSNSFNTFEGDYEGHINHEIRHQAWESFHNGLRKYQHTIATNYINRVQAEKKIASMRGFESVIDYLLFDQKVTRESYNLIIDKLTRDFAPVMRRYARLLKEEQGLERVTMADIKMPFIKGEPEKVSIEESQQLILEAFDMMGEEYTSILDEALNHRWIDYPMNYTKSTGGFCATSYQGPAYILLNWNHLLSEVLVLAHELGHAGHFVLQYKEQLAISPGPSMYFVEAPSTCNEVIMCQYLLNQNISNQAKRGLISEFISRTYYHNMVTHLMEADFQRKVYMAVDREEVLNAERLNQFFRESLESFWGDDVDIIPGAELTWMRQPHYHMGLYPYTYSAGLTVGTQMGQRIANGEEGAVAQWLEVLKMGGTRGPIELAEAAGVDMTDDQAIHQAIQYVSGLLDQIEALA